jgi:membrane protease YdiL (CAAX protease family)
MIPGYLYMDRLLKRWIPDRKTFRGIYATAMLFGMAHSWPDPIALFVLGLGLGYLAYRTQTLLGPILLHSLFNAVTYLYLILAQVALVLGHTFPA